MPNLLGDIGTYLQSQGIGTLGTDLFLGSIPSEAADASVFVLEGIGDEALETFGSTSATNIERPAIQILCRGASNDYATPRSTAESAKDAMQDIVDLSLTGARYLRARMRHPPFFIGLDENERPLISCNFDVWKEPN